ncbi:hypothetical protein JQC72_05520 [Polycladomyces sp. WAk]|uniref:Uncharacterized protein n=1 Tax=Polycladomyces zharkentensis TaxID=2807616 RepID=A0ABS2WHH8_9BACL|nr:hypothetical protein [Polycladomyces sp. WAk]MBN2908982.1 hypothetical protein [Polycladomyces sp. WAk]
MKKFACRISGALLMVLGVLCLWKFVELINTPVHVGVELHFYGFEIDKTVPEGDIPMYATSFLAMGALFSTVGGLLLKKEPDPDP